MSILFSFLILTFGFILLAFGANRLISGAINISSYLKLSPLIIGFTVIAIGTSIPETMVMISSIWHKMTIITIGNAIGADIMNIGFILGIAIMITPIKTCTDVFYKQLPLLFAGIFLIAVLLFLKNLTQIKVFILLFAYCALMVIYVRKMMCNNQNNNELDKKIIIENSNNKKKLFFALFNLLIGVVILPIGSEIIIKNVTLIAKHFHVSDLVIGLTVISYGTTLPELSTTIVGIIKRQHDIVIGNIVGSNIYNLLLVLISAFFTKPIINIKNLLLPRDFFTLLFMTIILYSFMYLNLKKNNDKLSRTQGSILFFSYILYLIVLL